MSVLLLPCAGKVHGSLARAGKVKAQTPKTPKEDKHRKPRGRAWQRTLYTRRFVTCIYGGLNGKKSYNTQVRFRLSLVFEPWRTLCTFLASP